MMTASAVAMMNAAMPICSALLVESAACDTRRRVFSRSVALIALRELSIAARAGRVRWVVCEVPRAVAQRRAATRLSDPGRTSDATPGVAEALAAAWEPPHEVAAADVLTLRTDRPAGAAADAVEAWMQRW